MQSRAIRHRPYRTLLLPWWALSLAAIASAYYANFQLPQHHLSFFASPAMNGAIDWLMHTRSFLFALNFTALCLGATSLSRLANRLVRKHHLLKMRSLAHLRNLRWDQFELLVAEAYRKEGYLVQETGLGGADGGVDAVLRRNGKTYIVQCKRWSGSKVGAGVVREMYGLMTHHSAAGVKIVCLSGFTKSAVSFAERKPIELLDGEMLLRMIQK